MATTIHPSLIHFWKHKAILVPASKLIYKECLTRWTSIVMEKPRMLL